MKARIGYLAIAIALTFGTMGCDRATGSLGEDAEFAESVDAETGSAKAASHYSSEIRVHASRNAATPVVPGAEARLVTNNAGASVAFNTRELAAGHAYTLWLVVINAPENCAGDPCTSADILFNTAAVQADVTYGAGHVVGRHGSGTFAGHLSGNALLEDVYRGGTGSGDIPALRRHPLQTGRSRGSADGTSGRRAGVGDGPKLL